LEIEVASGFVSDYTLLVRHNASIALATMPVWLYHGRSTRMAFRDLKIRLKPPNNLRYFLGLNLKFVPNPRRNVPWETFEREILPRFDRNLRVKVFMVGVNTDTTNPYNPKMYLSSYWIPPNLFTPVDLHEILSDFKAALKSQYKPRRLQNNLIPHQQRALNSLRNQDDFLIVQCDKH
jgi:hypothetical protein